MPAMAAAQTNSPAPAPATDRDDIHTPSDDLVVTAPYVRSLDVLGNVGVVEGDELARLNRPQIGDMLASLPGVSASSFSPGASRPVLRGFQGERVRVLVDGIGSIDASNTSVDHAVAFDSLTAERVEILRGPASLLFGSSAIGGAVNIFDRRIPRRVPADHVHVDALASYGSAANERSGGASVDVALASNIVAHVDGGYTRTNDLRIGGNQLAPTLRASVLADAAAARLAGDIPRADSLSAAANQRGVIPNTATETKSAGAGLAVINDGGSLGFSVSWFDTAYGIPARPGDSGGNVSIGLEQWRADVRAEVDLGGFFSALRFRAGFADYQHAEFDGPVIGTQFFNQGLEARAELVQARRGGWSGAIGAQYAFRDFNAVGAEAILPQNDTSQFALFALQEVQSGALNLQGSGRYEQVSLNANSIGYRRSFDLFSGAVGLSYALDDHGSKAGFNISSTTRAPSAEELLSNGPHPATQSFEIGNPNFSTETARSVEGYVRLRSSGGASIELTGYSSWFDNFIYEAATGAVADRFPVFAYRQGNATYWGFELEGRAPLGHVGPFRAIVDATADMVRARLSNGGGNIPRIPPLRLRGGLELATDNVSLRGEVEWADAQKRIATFETPTAGYVLANLSATWQPLGADSGLTLIASANNLFDVDARRHASFTKDFVPLPGRDFRVTARVSF